MNRLLLCIAGIAVNTAAHLLIYTLNDGIYNISNAHTLKAQESLEKMKELVENVYGSS